MKLDRMLMAADLLVPDPKSRDQVQGLIKDVWEMAKRETLEEVAVNYLAGDPPVFKRWLERELQSNAAPHTPKETP